MRRELLRTSSFVRAAKKVIKKNPLNAEDIKETLELLSENAYNPKLKTHKLKGIFKNSWACSAGYNLRVVFKFMQYENTEAILLETIGTHEEVY